MRYPHVDLLNHVGTMMTVLFLSFRLSPTEIGRVQQNPSIFILGGICCFHRFGFLYIHIEYN